MITYFGVGSTQVPEELRSAAVPSMHRCAAFPQNFLILQQTSPGLARSKGKECPSKLMGQQRGGTAHRRDGEGLVLAAGQGDAREIIRTGEGASREQDHAVWLRSRTPRD